MRRVLLLVKGLGHGGAERLLVGAVRYGDRDRFAYEVAYLLPWKDAFVPELRDLGVTVHCLGAGVGWPARLRALVRRRGIGLVHAHSPVPAVGARVALGRRVRLAYTEHNVWGRYRRATYWGNLLTFPRNDRVVAVSEEVRRSVRYPRGLRFLRMPPVETVYHGPDPAALAAAGAADGVRAELGVPPDAPVVGTVANFKPQKGLAYLIEAAVRVRREVPGVRFVVVGQGGPLEEELRARAGRLGLDETVVFAGYREDAPRVVSCFDLFVLPSLQEGLPIALVEAMALGKPAVVTRAGGNAEVVEDGRQGVVVPPGDAAALARGVVALLRDDDLRARLGRAARDRAALFDIRRAVRRVEEIYGELLQ